MPGKGRITGTRIGVAVLATALLMSQGAMLTAREDGRARDAVATDWWSHMQEGLGRFEYQPSISGGALQAPNRAHNMRTFFEESGIRVHDRTSGSEQPLVAMSLVALGRGPEPGAVKPGVVHQVGRRVEIRRAGVTEWYRNSAAGLEQGFTVWSRADGDGPLVLELTIGRAQARMRGTAVELLTDAGRRLDYGKLLAEDTRGRVLGSRLEVPAPDRLRLVIDDAGATYPLLIDPLLTERGKGYSEFRSFEAGRS